MAELVLPNLPKPVNLSVGNEINSLMVKNKGLRCVPSFFGIGLSRESCIQALSKMSRTDQEQEYIARSLNVPGHKLPNRYVSDDGACVIDVNFKSRNTLTSDTSSDRKIALATAMIIEKCIVEAGSGGVYTGFSEFD